MPAAESGRGGNRPKCLRNLIAFVKKALEPLPVRIRALAADGTPGLAERGMKTPLDVV